MLQQPAIRRILLVLILTGIFSQTKTTEACGGFFCQTIPINQAGEQIIFRKDGNMITAVVQIQYAGDARDFSWVVPVPGIPELSTGSDMVFSSLELATRPQFNLQVTGEPCDTFDLPSFNPGFFASPSAGDAANEDNSVDVLQTLSVGPFDVQVVTSNDANAMAQWLIDNDYDLTDRGAELIAPYVELGMNFVALKLQQDQGVGDLQPLIMRYESEDPMVPIRLTAVAAEQDMGVIVWLLGQARAVPLNYLHVTPNYTRLNWFFGNTQAYASYQNLITEAMNEAGGQGFATDYASNSSEFLSSLPQTQAFIAEQERLINIVDPAEMIVAFASNFIYPQTQVNEILMRQLRLPEDVDQTVYFNTGLLRLAFTEDELFQAKINILTELDADIIEPLSETIDILDDGMYMTRLYTTLSAEEMTLDPVFAFNRDMPDQDQLREAQLDISCELLQSRWTLTLGKGTGREGEVVIDGFGNIPTQNFGTPIPIDQDAVFITEETSREGLPTLKQQNAFRTTTVVNGQDIGSSTQVNFNFNQCGTGVCGVGVGMMTLFCLLGLGVFRKITQ